MTVLETDRLLLRHFTLDDADFILRLVNDPAFIANIGDQPSDLAGGNPEDRVGQFLLPNPFYRIP